MKQKQDPYKRLKDQCIEILMECHERQLMNLPPCLATETQYVPILTSKNLAELKFYVTKEGKRVLSLYITEKGIDYLNSLD